MPTVRAMLSGYYADEIIATRLEAGQSRDVVMSLRHLPQGALKPNTWNGETRGAFLQTDDVIVFTRAAIDHPHVELLLTCHRAVRQDVILCGPWMREGVEIQQCVHAGDARIGYIVPPRIPFSIVLTNRGPSATVDVVAHLRMHVGHRTYQ